MKWRRCSKRELEAARREAELAKHERLLAETRREAAKKEAEESMVTVQELREHRRQNGWTRTIYGVMGGQS